LHSAFGMKPAIIYACLKGHVDLCAITGMRTENKIQDSL